MWLVMFTMNIDLLHDILVWCLRVVRIVKGYRMSTNQKGCDDLPPIFTMKNTLADRILSTVFGDPRCDTYGAYYACRKAWLCVQQLSTCVRGLFLASMLFIALCSWFWIRGSSVVPQPSLLVYGVRWANKASAMGLKFLGSICFLEQKRCRCFGAGPLYGEWATMVACLEIRQRAVFGFPLFCFIFLECVALEVVRRQAEGGIARNVVCSSFRFEYN